MTTQTQQRGPDADSERAALRPVGPDAPQGASTADERAAAESARLAGRKRLFVGVIVAVGIALLAFVGHAWWFGRTHVVSDNAHVDGHIIPILTKVAGYVAEVRIEENQRVRAGDTLVVIDDRDFRARLEQAEADQAVALAAAGSSGRAGQAEAQLSAARAAVAQAEANAWKAHNDLERYRSLVDRSLVSRQQFDAAQAAAQAADAQLRAARDQVTAAGAGVSGAQARVEAARAARDLAALQLSYTRITAPDSGVVSKKNVEVGQLVQAGQPLMSLVPLNDVWVVANLKETELADVTPGDRVEIRVDTYSGRKFLGQVESISPASGAKFSLLPPDNATGNFTKVVQRVPVRIRLNGPQDPDHLLRPGMSVKVAIATR